MPAAIFAAQAGGKVLVIEATPVIGGTLDRSTGQVAASGTVWQKSKGITDTPAAHYADHMRINNSSSVPGITRLFVDEAPDTLNWLAANGFTVIDGDPVKGKGHDPFTVERYQNGPERGRSILKAMMPSFEAAVSAGQIELKLETQALELLQNSAGEIVGIVAQTQGGARTEYFGHKVLIATGGCAANPVMFQNLHGVALSAAVARPSSQGHGLLLAQSVGGFVRGGEKYVPLYGVLLESDTLPSGQSGSFRHDPAARPPWEIHVNASGERFVREDHPSHEYRQHALARQAGQMFWVVGDRETLERAPPFLSRWNKELVAKAFADGHPMFSQGDTVKTLGLRAGIDPRGLQKSIDLYNAALTGGSEDPYGRTFRPCAIAAPPYFAVRMSGWTVFSFAGVAVDDSLRVLRPDGSIIPNLLAAGEVIGGGATSGSAYTNGAMVTPALAFGRWIGRRIKRA
jgi:fumarate reductase flavoprotein subunit